ncbi:MAG TPA: acyl-CoA dehydrogenase family protein [Acidimicrobiales bacterium]|jgi:alkylation response protein AidB-like acyl-CoA dehydrogenase
MDLEPTDDQAALAAELARFLADRVTPEARRAAAGQPGAVDRDLWRALGELGTFSLTVPEARGGVGLGTAEATLVFEELGRAAVPGPLIGTFLAAGLDVAVAGAAGTGDAAVGLVPAGRPAFVEHRAGLDALLVVSPDGVALAGPPDAAAGRPVSRPLDPLTPVDVVDELPEGEPVGGPDLAVRLRRDAGLLAAALQVGLAGGALVMATDYAQGRVQFGRPIGSFQALKHLLADACVAVEVARAAVAAAGVAMDEAGGEAGRAVDAARIVASRAADRATRACIQVHGGIGFTWELDAHLFLKRALVLDVGVWSADDAVESLAATL